MCVVRRPTSLTPRPLSHFPVVPCPLSLSSVLLAHCSPLISFATRCRQRRCCCRCRYPCWSLRKLPTGLCLSLHCPFVARSPLSRFPFFPTCSCALIYMLELSLQRLAISIVVLLSPFCEGTVSSDLCAYAKDLMTLA